MPLPVATAFEVPKNVESINKKIPNPSSGDAGDFAGGLNPRKHVSVLVQKNGEAAKVYLTNTVVKLDGTPITSLDDADIIWHLRSSGTADFFVGDEKGLTGWRVKADNDPTTTGDIKISVAQM